MSRLKFEPEEFALLEVTLRRINEFLHAASRSPEELADFQRETYPLVRRLYYEVLGDRFTDDERDKLSLADVGDMSIADQLELWSRFFRGWT